MNLIAYCDGSLSLLQIAERIGQPMWELIPMLDQLLKVGLLTIS
jgi:aminopeptidase-like protein